MFECQLAELQLPSHSHIVIMIINSCYSFSFNSDDEKRCELTEKLLQCIDEVGGLGLLVILLENFCMVHKVLLGTAKIQTKSLI